MKSTYLIQDTILRVYATSLDEIIISDIDITTFLPNNTKAYSKKKINDQFEYLFTWRKNYGLLDNEVFSKDYM